MGLNWAEHSVEIEASIATCFGAIVDYESFPNWQSAVVSTEVHTRTAAGIGEIVSLYLSTKGQKLNYTLNYRYDEPTGIEWDFVKGNGVDDVDGSYTFVDLGGGRTRATYRLGIDPSLPVPGFVARRIHRTALQASVYELKAEAERRRAELGERPEAEATLEKEPAVGEPEPAVRESEPAPEPREPEPAAREPEPEPTRAAAPPPQPAADEPVGRAPSGPGDSCRQVERALATGRDLTEGTVRAGIAIAGGAFGLARGAARTALGIGCEAADAVTGRVSKLVWGDDRRGDDR